MNISKELRECIAALRGEGKTFAVYGGKVFADGEEVGRFGVDVKLEEIADRMDEIEKWLVKETAIEPDNSGPLCDPSYREREGGLEEVLTMLRGKE